MYRKVLLKHCRDDLTGTNFDGDISLKYIENEPQTNNRVVHYDQIQSIEVTENTTPIQMDAYDVIRGSENPSPKSVDSQFSVEDKVIYIACSMTRIELIWIILLNSQCLH